MSEESIVVFVLYLFLTVIGGIGGCDFEDFDCAGPDPYDPPDNPYNPPPDDPTYTISDATLHGINGYDSVIAGDINVDPNSGDMGTPVTITITFTRGAQYVEGIEQYDFCAQNNYNSFYNWTIEMQQTSDTRWRDAGGSVLTGNDCVMRYYAVNSDNMKVCFGDVRVNSPSTSSVPSWDEDGIGTSKNSASSFGGGDCSGCLGIVQGASGR